MEHVALCAAVVSEVKKAVVGKDEAVVKVLLAILARGHILLEDIPGVGKTTMALAFAKALGLTCRRVQFTPDVMPSDLTGFSIYNKATGQMEYQPGAVLCNLFLADELNRATSRTQSAQLEAMEEGQVTVDGVSHPLPSPILVIATQNPAGASGTQPLPDSQLDRFLMRLTLGYPRPEDELELLRRRRSGAPLEGVRQVAGQAELERLCRAADAVYLSDEVLDYIVRLVGATRSHPGGGGGEPGRRPGPGPGLCDPRGCLRALPGYGGPPPPPGPRRPGGAGPRGGRTPCGPPPAAGVSRHGPPPRPLRGGPSGRPPLSDL